MVLVYFFSVSVSKAFITSCVILLKTVRNLDRISVGSGVVNICKKVADQRQLGEIPLWLSVTGSEGVQLGNNQVCNKSTRDSSQSEKANDKENTSKEYGGNAQKCS